MTVRNAFTLSISMGERKFPAAPADSKRQASKSAESNVSPDIDEKMEKEGKEGTNHRSRSRSFRVS